MASQPWYKSEIAIAGAIITLLLSLTLGLVKWEYTSLRDEMKEFKQSNKDQWAKAAEMRQWVSDEIAGLRERLSNIEGYHKAEQDYGCKTKGELK